MWRGDGSGKGVERGRGVERGWKWEGRGKGVERGREGEGRGRGREGDGYMKDVVNNRGMGLV